MDLDGISLIFFVWCACYSGNHKQRFYWGTKEIMIPVYEVFVLTFVLHFHKYCPRYLLLCFFFFFLFLFFLNIYTYVFFSVQQMSEAMTKHPDVDVMINFASLRSAYDSTMETLRYSQVLIVSAGIPFRKTHPLSSPIFLTLHLFISYTVR